MDFYQFFGFAVILKESIKLLCKNGKLMVLVTTLSLVFSSIFFLFFDFSSFSLMRDMLAKESLIPISSSNSAEFVSQLSGIKENFPHLLTVYVTFVLSYFTITFLSMMATVIVSAESYNSKNLSLKELSLGIVKSWTRPFLTGFYTTIFVIGYVFFVISMATPLLVYSKTSILGAAVLFGVVAYIFYLYLSSVWIMSLVVSVVDQESCGIEALGKSAEIMKGQKMNGFLLNIVFNLVSLGVYLGSKMIRGEKYWISDEKISGLFLVNCSCLVKILTFVAYTVLYFRGKESRGQEIELHWSNVEYAKLGVTPLVGVP
ncbi:hypothetical protein Pfo_000746 [Paulownia fortunei]|nr:hypothetical protein Pfo_000746 [Paulownia fortunei]